MRALYANYIFAIVVLFFFKIILVDQVRAGFRGQNHSVEVQSADRSVASASTRLAPIR